MNKLAKKLPVLLIVLILLSPFFAHAMSCAEEIGEKVAKQLVRQCINVSPSTHPPCNVLNSCELIRDEIKHGCKFLINDPKPPKYCFVKDSPPETVVGVLIDGGGYDDSQLTFRIVGKSENISAYCDGHCDALLIPVKDNDGGTTIRKSLKGRSATITYATEANKDRIAGDATSTPLVFIKRAKLNK